MKTDIITVRSRSGAGNTHALDRRYSANERALCGIRVSTTAAAHSEVTCRRCRDLKNAPGTPPPQPTRPRPKTVPAKCPRCDRPVTTTLVVEQPALFEQGTPTSTTHLACTCGWHDQIVT